MIEAKLSVMILDGAISGILHQRTRSIQLFDKHHTDPTYPSSPPSLHYTLPYLQKYTHACRYASALSVIQQMNTVVGALFAKAQTIAN